LGQVLFAPVDVRFSDRDQVQPDLLFIRGERLDIYQGHTVQGAPDLVVEIVSPSDRSFDEVRKRALYEANGVPEYWIVDPKARTLRLLVLTEGRYVEAAPRDGRLRSTVLPDLVVDPAALFAGLD
jgi:Uma2 family endonuclease